VAPWLPNGAVVSAARDVAYFPDASLRHPLLVLGIWLAGSLAVLARMDLLHVAERRRAPEREAEIYATPGTSHVRQRRARRRAAAAGLPSPASASPAGTQGSVAGALAAVDVQDLAGDERGGFEVENAGHHVADLADTPRGMELCERREGFRRV
jgi:hypothetical protein